MPLMRLDRFFSSQEIISRKEIKQYIKSGAIKINGNVAKIVDEKIDTDKDEVFLNNQIVSYKPYIYIMLNKPMGVVSATNDKHHKTVLDLVPPSLFRSDLFPAGRLDKDTEGFVLITNDGDFAHSMLAPKNHVEKNYIAILDASLKGEDIVKIEAGITLADETVCQKAKLAVLKQGENPLVSITICEGKYHQIKRMFGAVDIGVNYLKRTRIGSLVLDENLALGECREILYKEIQQILANKVTKEQQ